MKTKELVAIIRAQIDEPRPQTSAAKWEKGVWETALNMVQYRDKDEELNVKTDFLNGHGTVMNYCDERLKYTSVLLYIDVLFCGLEARMLWDEWFKNEKETSDKLRSFYYRASAEALRKIKYILFKEQREAKPMVD